MIKKIKVQVGDFKLQKKERNAILRVLDSGRISEGEKTYQFEQEWAKFIGTKYCIAASSGTGALITLLTVLKYKYNLKQGTKVITTPTTYIAASSAISVVGFEPVYVDIDPKDFVITPDRIENYLKSLSLKELKKHK